MNSRCKYLNASLVLLALFLLVGTKASGKDSATRVTAVILAQDDGATTVSIETDGKALFSVTKIKDPNKVFIDIKGSSLSGSIEMPLETTSVVNKTVVEEFDEGILGKTSRVTLHLSQPAKMKKQSTSKKHITIELRPLAAIQPSEPEEPEPVLSVKKEATPKVADEKEAASGPKPVAKSSAVKKTAPGKAAAAAVKESKYKVKSKLVGSEDPSIYSFHQEETASAFSSFPKQVALAKKKPAPAVPSKKIDLDFKDADIHNILRLLSEVGNINIVAGDDVKGTVTLRMRDVPWNMALDVILEAKNLGKVKLSSNVFRVAPKEALEQERQMKIKELTQKKILKPLKTMIIPVSYAMAKELKPQTEKLMSSRGNIEVDDRTNVLIVRDVDEHLLLIEQLVRNLDTQTPQVLIEARIVESTSNYSREIGIQWGGHFAASSALGNPTGIVFPNSVVLAGGGQDDQTPVGGMNPFGESPNPNFAVNLPAITGTGAGGALGISLGSVNNNTNLNIRLSALENDGVLKIISAPKILTLDNKEATIEQGTMIPYSQVSAQGVQTAFQEAKLSLVVTPHVTSEGSVLMKLEINRDEPDFNNRGARGDPTILKRHADTELLIDDGKTAVIGGIYTRNYGKSYNQVPGLAKIPVIGWLFKKRTDTDRRSELLIFITPRIVNRAESIGQ
ncbi:MAG: type IV pilus secretin PilQ [Pseudomonadota bacterium]